MAPPTYPETASAADGPRRTPSKWMVLAIVGIGVFMCTLDSSIVNVSLPATLAATFVHGFRAALLVCAALAALAIVTSLLRGREQR